MSDVAVVEKELNTFFGSGKVPPLVFVEWKSSKESPIEIELIAHRGKAYPSAPDVIDYITPPGMTSSPVFSRVSHIRYGPSIYVSGLVATKDKLDTRAEVEDLFATLRAILSKADSDLKHLAKATYYVATDETSKALNEVRPGLYDPKRPPAASKAMVSGVAHPGRNISFDMIAVPTLKVPTTPPEMGHGLTPKEAAEGWISVFDGQTPFGWADGMVNKGVLERGTTETVFGNCALRADVDEAGVLKIAGEEHNVQVGAFTLAETGGKGVIELAGGVKLRSLQLKPLGLKPIFNGKSLDGWKRIDREGLPEDKRPVWKVEKEAIVATGGPGALEYQGTNYGDFVMQVDVKTRVRHANGGVFFRAIPGDFMNGYEAQVYNRCVDGDPSKPVIWTTGAIDNRQNARRLVSRDFEPYRMTVIARGQHLSTWINGYQAVDWTDTRDSDPNPRKGMRLEAGVIQLQAHDPLTDLEYRSIQIGE
jgi:enamine deaminase RidA (YjgF/YER057c/UK114 family)